MKTSRHIITGLVTAIILTLGVASVQAVTVWQGPTATPPGGMTDAPINVGANTQSKLGALFLNTAPTSPFAVGLGVFGKSSFQQIPGQTGSIIQIADGTEGDGRVLVSDASGNASWGNHQVTPHTCGVGEAVYGILPSGEVLCRAVGGGDTVIIPPGQPHGSVQFTTVGNASWTVPTDVTSITVEVAGGHGGSGASGTCGGSNGWSTGSYSVGGGGSGGYGRSVISVSPGNNIGLTVGNKGNNWNGAVATDGQQSTFGSVYSTGGLHGTSVCVTPSNPSGHGVAGANGTTNGQITGLASSITNGGKGYITATW